jgi:uncharacterized protein (TIGR02145 family)
MKTVKFLATAIVFVFGCTLFAQTAQAQTAKGPEREITFTVQPHSGKNGYEVKITFKYRFQLCVDKISLYGYRTKHEPQAYWYNGKRYNVLDLRQLNSKNNTDVQFAPADQHLYPNLDFSADIYAYRQQGKGTVTLGEPEFYAKGSWFWVNFTANWGGCLGDYGGKYEGYETEMSAARKNRIGDLLLKNIKAKDSPSRDYAIENALGGKTQRPLETFKDVKQVTETLKSEAKSAAAERENANKQTKNGKNQSVDDLLNSTGRAEKQQDLDALLGSTGYAKQEVSSRNLAQADAAAANVTSFADRTHLAEAQKLYQKALADQPDNTHVANQLQRVEWILKNGGVIWAEKNVGANSPEDYGNYYTWEEACKVCPEGWRLPTNEEIMELVETGSEWTTVNGVGGRKFSNKAIFLPAAGYRNHHLTGAKLYVGADGYYWSSSPTGTNPFSLSFDGGGIGGGNAHYRSNGFTVRCVAE